jgi:hypothetical protein
MAGDVEGGLGNDKIEPPVARRLREPIQHLEGISQTGRDYLRCGGG